MEIKNENCVSTSLEQQTLFLFEKFKGQSKQTKIILVSIACFFSIIFTLLGVTIGKSAKLNEVDKNYTAKLEKIEAAKSKLDVINSEICKQQSTVDAINEYNGNMENYSIQESEARAKINDLNAQITEKQTKLDGITAEIDTLNNKIAMLKQDYESRRGQGYTFSAGYYYGGEHLPEGRYDIVLVGGSGNVFVDDEFGRSIVNEVFGTGYSYYIKEFKNVPIATGSEIKIRGCTVKFIEIRSE